MFISDNQIILNINRGMYKYIGEGSSRKVFDLNNGYVIKIAKNRAGVEQNKMEYYISTSDDTGLFAKVVQASNNYNFIIMRRATRIGDISYVWRYFNVKNKIEFLRLPELQKIKNKYNLLLNDLNRESSWGLINGKIVIIDYGFTRKVRDRYY